MIKSKWCFDLAERFINLARSAEGKAILEKHGYETP
jgi:ABC-type molybdate transport system substrate-binding protein